MKAWLTATVSLAVMVALSDASARFPLPVAALGELIEGVRMDVRGDSYERFEDLLVYCRRVAGAIGRLCLAVFGARRELSPSGAQAQEWPRFRGPNGSGVSATILPTRWTDKDYRWQVKLPGPGHSSPVLWSERLFVTSAEGPRKLHVLCLDAASGRTLWNRELAAGPPGGHKDNNIASATPARPEGGWTMPCRPVRVTRPASAGTPWRIGCWSARLWPSCRRLATFHLERHLGATAVAPSLSARQFSAGLAEVALRRIC